MQLDKEEKQPRHWHLNMSINQPVIPNKETNTRMILSGKKCSQKVHALLLIVHVQFDRVTENQLQR